MLCKWFWHSQKTPRQTEQTRQRRCRVEIEIAVGGKMRHGRLNTVLKEALMTHLPFDSKIAQTDKVLDFDPLQRQRCRTTQIIIKCAEKVFFLFVSFVSPVQCAALSCRKATVCVFVLTVCARKTRHEIQIVSSAETSPVTKGRKREKRKKDLSVNEIYIQLLHFMQIIILLFMFAFVCNVAVVVVAS